MEMSAAVLRDICVQNKQYRTPGLNDKLYLNYKGFARLAGLEAYTGLRALFLEGNALSSLEGLPRLEELKCLYMQQNCLRCLDGVERLPQLDTLNVSSNGLLSLAALTACAATLATLVAERNQLSSPEALRPLAECTHLHTLDLQSNGIEDPCVLDLLAGLPALRCLYLKGNPVVSAVPNYRKAIISRCAHLTYLDERPVSDEERRCAEAWAAGGMEAERATRAAIKEETAARDRRNFEWMQQLRREGFRKRRAMLGLPDGDTDPYWDTLDGGCQQQGDGKQQDGSDDGEGSLLLREPPELLEARAALAAYTARPGEEEPPELAHRRQQLVQQGEAVQEGSWAAAGSGGEGDGAIYLASVKQAQQDLDAGGAAATGGLADTGAAPGTPTTLPRLHHTGACPDLGRLKAATRVAFEAVGLAGGKAPAPAVAVAAMGDAAAPGPELGPAVAGMATAASWSSSSSDSGGGGNGCHESSADASAEAEAAAAGGAPGGRSDSGPASLGGSGKDEAACIAPEDVVLLAQERSSAAVRPLLAQQDARPAGALAPGAALYDLD